MPRYFAYEMNALTGNLKRELGEVRIDVVALVRDECTGLLGCTFAANRREAPNVVADAELDRLCNRDSSAMSMMIKNMLRI